MLISTGLKSVFPPLRNCTIDMTANAVSIRRVTLLLAVWVMICHLAHDGFHSLNGFLSDVRMRNAVLLFFYYSLSSLSFRYFSKVSFALTLTIMLLLSMREACIGAAQLISGSRYPVGTMLNPNILACFLAVTCSVLMALIPETGKKAYKWLLYVIIGLYIILMFFSKSRLALLSVIVPGMCYCCLDPRYSVFIRKHALSVAVLFAVLFTVMYFVKKPSADGRIYMAKIAARAMVHNGMFGAGTEGYAGAFGQEQYRYYSSDSGNADIDAVVENDRAGDRFACEPLTAFNEFLRVGVEYGIVAMLLLLYIIARAIFILLKRRSPLGYGLLSLSVVSLFSYPHCYSAYCLLLSIFLGSASDMDSGFENAVSSYCPLAADVIGLLLSGLMLFLELPGMERRNQLRDKESDIAFFFRNREYQTVCDCCESFFDKDLSSITMVYEYGVSLSMTGQYHKSDSVLSMGASRSSDPAFWQEMGNNHLRNGQYDEAEKSYIRSFLMVPNRMTPLLFLARLYHQTGDREKLDRIDAFADTFRPKIPSNTTREYHKIIKQLANEE